MLERPIFLNSTHTKGFDWTKKCFIIMWEVLNSVVSHFFNLQHFSSLTNRFNAFINKQIKFLVFKFIRPHY